MYMYVLELGLSGSGLCGLYVGCGYSLGYLAPDGGGPGRNCNSFFLCMVVNLMSPSISEKKYRKI